MFENILEFFHEHTESTEMTILASQALLCENKKNPVTQMLPH